MVDSDGRHNTGSLALVPQAIGRRILEAEIDRLLARQLGACVELAHFMFSRCFDATYQFVQLIGVRTNVHVDRRAHDQDQLAYGENDLEVVASAVDQRGAAVKLALLLEDKVNAKLMPNQARRYRVRGDRRIKAGEWHDYRCALVAPRSYVSQRYPLKDHAEHGWHAVFEFEEISRILIERGGTSGVQDAQLLLDATLPENHVLEPILAAVQFFKDYIVFGRERFPDVPVEIRTEVGSRAGGVWPSFYDHEFFYSKNPIRRRIQITHIDHSDHVVLWIKKVAFEEFMRVLGSYIASPMIPLKRTSWQGIMLKVPRIDATQPFSDQQEAIRVVFEAARYLYAFFVAHEVAIVNLLARQNAKLGS